MSKIAKGIKKVFKGVGKFLKKIAKPVLIGAAIFFTAGLAAGGFAAFSGVSSIGGFFGAVGNTIGVGFQATMGTLGLGSGVSASMAGATGVAQGTTLGTGALAQGLGLSAGPGAAMATPQAGAGVLKAGSAPALSGEVTATSLSNLGGPAASGYAGGTAGSKIVASGSGLVGKAFNAFNGMSNVGQLMVAQGIMGGIQSYAASEEAEKKRRQFQKSGVFGVARGEKYADSDVTPEQIYDMAAQVPGTNAAQQQATGTGFFAGNNQGQTQVPGQASGQSLIGQTYEDSEQGPSSQNAYVQGYTNPYNQNNTQNRPLLG